MMAAPTAKSNKHAPTDQGIFSCLNQFLSFDSMADDIEAGASRKIEFVLAP